MMRTYAAVGLLALAASAGRAGDDELRLRLPDAADTRTLAMRTADADDADTLAMHWRGGFVGFRGGWGRPGWGGGWGRPGWGGGVAWGRPGWGGGVAWGRPAWGVGWGHRPWGHGGGWGWGGGWGYRGVHWAHQPWGWHSGWASPGFVTVAPPVVSQVWFSPCAGVEAVPPTTLEYRILPATPMPSEPTLPAPGLRSAPPVMPRADGTFPYNGGPMAPVPMPEGEDISSLPRVPTPIIDRVVSLKDEPKTGKFVYPAYGETPRRSGK